jgi:hypothetical protein
MSQNNNDENSNDSEQIKANTDNKKFLISKFTDDEIEINRKKHKYIFEAAIKIYYCGKLKIDDFMKKFNVNYQATVTEENYKLLFQFSLNDTLIDPDTITNDQLEQSFKTSPILTKEKYEKIIECLVNPDLCKNSNFKNWVLKKAQFNIVENQLHRMVTDNKNITKNLPVTYFEEFFDICYRIHSIERGHIGILKSEDCIKERYFGITRDVARLFNRYCFICNLTSGQRSQARLKPISSNSIHERGQLDLIDMSHSPVKHLDIEYKWIAHYEDHFIKYHVLWAQPKKEMIYVVDGLENRVFSYFGLPVILQTDNG